MNSLVSFMKKEYLEAARTGKIVIRYHESCHCKADAVDDGNAV